VTDYDLADVALVANALRAAGLWGAALDASNSPDFRTSRDRCEGCREAVGELDEERYLRYQASATEAAARSVLAALAGRLRPATDEPAPPVSGSATGFRPWEDLRSSGLLWLINRVVFHPRGWALSLMRSRSSGEIRGWRLLGDGREVWRFVDPEDDLFAAAQATLAPLVGDVATDSGEPDIDPAPTTEDGGQ
jgi:hypothetical protein